MMDNDLLLDVSCPLNWEWPENFGLVANYAVLPGQPMGGKTWFDAVRGAKNPNNGTLTNFNFDTADGWRGATHKGGYGSLLFDGTDDKVATSLIPATGSNARTLCGWMFNGSPGGGATFASYGTDTALARISVSTVSASQTQIGMAIHSANIFYNCANLLNSWHHWCLSMKSGQTLAQIAFYLDGLLLTSVASSVGSSSVPNTGSGTGLMFGVDIGGAPFFIGNQNDNRAYNRALSAAEVQNLYLESSVGYPNGYNWIKPKTYSFSTAVAASGLLMRRRRAVAS